MKAAVRSVLRSGLRLTQRAMLWPIVGLALLCALELGPHAHAQELPFRRAIELALQHSGAMAAANADELRARAGLQEAREAEQIVSDRLHEGVDSEVELTRAKLTTAKVVMNIAQSQGAADLLRARLSQLTGLPADSIRTLTESIPKLPEVNQDSDLA